MAGLESYTKLLQQQKDLIRPRVSSGGLGPYCPFSPNSGPQERFVFGDSRELFYGGGTGGGKTFGLLMCYLKDAHKPWFRGLLIRRTYKSLTAPDGPVWLADNWLSGTPARWQATKQRWLFPEGGILQFAHCNHDDAVQQLMGPSWSHIGIDELGEFPTPRPWIILLTRLRRLKGAAFSPIFRGTGNPGGPGQDWIYHRFVRPASGETTSPRYIHSTLHDNVNLDREDYEEVLRGLPEAERKFYLEGDWTAKRAGRIYPYEESNLFDGVSILPSGGWVFTTCVDLGTDQREPTTAFCTMAWDPDHPNKLYMLECYKMHANTPTAVEEELVRIYDRWGPTDTFIDPGGLGKGWIDEINMRKQVWARPVQKSRGYKLTMRSLFADALQEGALLISRDTCRDWCAEADALIWNDKGTDCLPDAKDHCTDAAGYCFLQSPLYDDSGRPMRVRTQAEEEEEAAFQRSLRGVE